MKKIASIAFMRPDAPEHDRFWKCGILFAQEPNWTKPVLVMYAGRVGDFIGRATVSEPPYIHGQLEVTVMESVVQKCGFITTSESDDGKIVRYHVRLDLLPMIAQKDRTGCHMRINQEVA